MSAAPTGFLRAAFTLLAGNALAQVLPLLVGPWLTRLYTPAEFGYYTVFTAISTNLAVVACARYDFALPLARDDAHARDLMALCLRVLLVVVGVTALIAWALGTADLLHLWGWLPFAVAVAGSVQWLTLWATRAERFAALAASRVTLYGGAAVLQVLGGLLHAGPSGLVGGPILAGGAAILWLSSPPPLGGWRNLARIPHSVVAAVARRHRAFPILNTPHAFAGALQDTLAVAVLVAWSGEASVGLWGLALRYLKAPATLVGGAVSQVLYPKLVHCSPAEARATVRWTMCVLALIAIPLVALLMLAGPALFAIAFGERWRGAGELARALAPYIGAHFVASPLSVVTLAWGAQGWALKLALVGQVLFLTALVGGLHWGGLSGGAWAVSGVMVLYFGWYFARLPGRCPDLRDEIKQ